MITWKLVRCFESFSFCHVFIYLSWASLRIVQIIWQRHSAGGAHAVTPVFSCRKMKFTEFTDWCTETSVVSTDPSYLSKGRLFTDHFLCQCTTGTTNPWKVNWLFLSDSEPCLPRFCPTALKHTHTVQTGSLNSSWLWASTGLRTFPGCI